MSAQRDLVEDSPAVVPGDKAGPGERGPHGGRRRTVSWSGTISAVVAVVALVVGGAALLRPDRSEHRGAEAPSDALHLPKAVNTPGSWSDDEGPTGPLAALGLALRTRPAGLTGERQQLQLFGVSAVDGRSAWVHLPGVDVEDQALAGWFALSPDGRWVAWQRLQQPQRPGGAAALVGWAVMDTTTRKVRELTVPSAPTLRQTASDLVFSGDSRYLLTSYETPDAPRTRGHRFVAWNVQGGTPTTLEQPGHYWLPNPGSAPTAVVWSRERAVYRDNPATGERSSYSLPQSVVTASWAPDDTAFAYIGRPADGSRGPWRLYAGRTLTEARDRPLALHPQPDQLLGWRDNRHVVVGHFRSTVQVVDVVTGHVVELDMAGYGKPLNAPLLAADLWRNPLVASAPPDGTTDPRLPFLWAGGALLALLACALLLRRRRTHS